MGKMGYPPPPGNGKLGPALAGSGKRARSRGPDRARTRRQKLAGYERNAGQATQLLLETVRRTRLNERQLRLLAFAAQHPEVLAILESVQDLLTSGGANPDTGLRAAEINNAGGARAFRLSRRRTAIASTTQSVLGQSCQGGASGLRRKASDGEPAMSGSVFVLMELFITAPGMTTGSAAKATRSKTMPGQGIPNVSKLHGRSIWPDQTS